MTDRIASAHEQVEPVETVALEDVPVRVARAAPDKEKKAPEPVEGEGVFASGGSGSL